TCILEWQAGVSAHRECRPADRTLTRRVDQFLQLIAGLIESIAIVFERLIHRDHAVLILDAILFIRDLDVTRIRGAVLRPFVDHRYGTQQLDVKPEVDHARVTPHPECLTAKGNGPCQRITLADPEFLRILAGRQSATDSRRDAGNLLLAGSTIFRNVADAE